MRPFYACKKLDIKHPNLIGAKIETRRDKSLDPRLIKTGKYNYVNYFNWSSEY